MSSDPRLQTRINTLDDRVMRLEDEVRILKRRIASLEKDLQQAVEKTDTIYNRLVGLLALASSMLEKEKRRGRSSGGEAGEE